MKRFLAILLALVMVLGLVACGGGNADKDTTSGNTTSGDTTGDTTGGDASTDTTTSSGGAFNNSDEPIDNTATGEIGMYDPNYDYNANPRYKVCYYVLTTGVLYEAFGEAFKHWCSVMNLEYGGMIDAGGDKDLYLSNMVTLANEYDGLLIDPDAEQYTRCAEILDEAGTPWMGCMAEARDYTQEGAPLMHPFCGFDSYAVGEIMADYLWNYAQNNWDVDISEVAFATVDFSTSPPLHQREIGFRNKLLKYDATIADRYWTADTSIAMFDVDTSNTVMSSLLAEHPEYEYWCVFGEIDDMAQGAAGAFDTAGLTDTAAVVTFGGTGLQLQWDAGMQDAWVAACYLPQTIYAEPIIGALYAFMNGDATAETIWPEWVPAYEPVPYAMRRLPSFWIEYETYKHVIRWSDIYAGSDFYASYPSEGITRDDFSTKMPIPESYALTERPVME